MSVLEIEATPNKRLVFDEKGFFVIFLRDGEIVAEHYENISQSDTSIETGKLDVLVVGKSSKAMCHTIMREGLVSRLDHAAYIGRELQKAEFALAYNKVFEQDEDLREK